MYWQIIDMQLLLYISYNISNLYKFVTIYVPFTTAFWTIFNLY